MGEDKSHCLRGRNLSPLSEQEREWPRKWGTCPPGPALESSQLKERQVQRQTEAEAHEEPRFKEMSFILGVLWLPKADDDVKEFEIIRMPEHEQEGHQNYSLVPCVPDSERSSDETSKSPPMTKRDYMCCTWTSGPLAENHEGEGVSYPVAALLKL